MVCKYVLILVELWNSWFYPEAIFTANCKRSSVWIWQERRL